MKKGTKKVVITPEVEEKMRLLANLIIDRMLEDKKTRTIKVLPKKRVNQGGNTT